MSWVGFDLDGTLAKWEHGDSVQQIGEPIAPMVRICQGFINVGVRVKIMTARVGQRMPNDPANFVEKQRDMIRRWTSTHIGYPLEATCEKDFEMALLFDDRAVGVLSNKGHISARPTNCEWLLECYDPWEDAKEKML